MGKPSQTIPPEYSFLTQPSLVVANPPTTTLESSTSFTLGTGAPTASPSVAALPAGIPARIYPATQIDPNTDLTGFTVISILFNQQLNWQFEATNPDSSNQIFAYFPGVIATALGINRVSYS